MSSGLKRTTLKEQAYRTLKNMIISHRFSSGKWINVERLAKELGVSRTPVWQALKDLEKEGLVTYVANKGMRMAEMTPEMAGDLYQVRGGLEAMAAALAAKRVTAEFLDKIEANLTAQRSAVNGKDLLAYSETDFEFHSLIYENTGNWMLKEFLENIKSRSRPLLCDISPILPELLEDHLLVYRAFRTGDSKAAEQAILEHNERMRRCVLRTGLRQDREVEKKRRLGSASMHRKG